METINMQCKNTSQIHTLRSLLYAKSCLSGRACIGEEMRELHIRLYVRTK